MKKALFLFLFFFSAICFGQTVDEVVVEVDHPVDSDENKELAIYLSPILHQTLNEQLLKSAEQRILELERYRTASCIPLSSNNQIKCVAQRIPVISDIQIENLPLTMLERDLRKRLFLQIGDTFELQQKKTQALLQRQKNAISTFLKRQGFYDTTVEISATLLPNSALVTITIQILDGGFGRIKGIDIVGDTPISEEWIKKIYDRMCFNINDFVYAFGVGSWSCYSKLRERDATQQIQARLNTLGYFQATIRTDSQVVDCKTDRPWQKCFDLTIQINEGPRVVTDFVLPDAQQLDLNAGGRFFRTIFGVEFFSRMFDKSLAGGRWPADQTILIHELRNALTFADARIVNQREISASVANIKSALASRGYLNSDVTVKKLVENEQLIHLRFEIVTKEPASVAGIVFSGNSSFSSSELLENVGFEIEKRSLLASGHVRPEALASDTQRIIGFYKNKGFKEIKVSSQIDVLSNNVMRVVFQLEEGPRDVVKKIIFLNDIPEVSEKALPILSNCQNHQEAPDCRNSAFLPELLPQDEKRLTEYYNKEGYLDAEISSNVVMESDGYIIEFRFQKPPERSILSGFLIDGNNKTLREVILREIGEEYTRKGEPLVPAKIDEGLGNLRQYSLFSRLDFQMWPEEDGSKRVFGWVGLVERPSFSVDTSILFGTDRLFGLEVNLWERNLFGAILELETRLALGLFWGRRTDLENIFRWNAIWGSDLDFELTAPYLLYEDRSNRDPADRHFKAEAVPLLKWHATRHLVPYIRYRVRLDQWQDQDAYEHINLIDTPLRSLSTLDGLILTWQQSLSTRGILEPGLSYSSVDNQFNPKKGMRAKVYTQLSAGIFGAQYPYIVLGGELTNYVSFGPFTLATNLVFTGALIESPANNWWVLKYQSDMDTLGGDRTVRGYQEGSIGVLGQAIDDRGNIQTGEEIHPGNLSLLGNIELRFPLAKELLVGDLDGAIFADVGFVDICTNVFDCQTFRGEWKNIQQDRRLGMGIGVGLRYVLPIGPIALDLAVSPVHEAEGGNGLFGMQTRVHLLFGYPF